MARISPRGHREWCSKVWQRMDRDRSASITVEELDSDDFRSILRFMMVPQRGNGTMGGLAYERSRMDVSQAVHFCMTKADINNDKAISFEEFESFMMYMRQDHTSKQTADLVFAMFDLNMDHMIEQDEFREIYRFYLGHNPTEVEFQAEWRHLDAEGKGVSRQQYARWLETSENPVCRRPPSTQVAAQAGQGETPGLSPASQELSREGTLREMRRRHERLERREGRHAHTRRVKNATPVQPLWLQRFNKPTNINDEVPSILRNYFGRNQSLPELARHCASHGNCKEMQRRLAEPKKAFKAPVLPPETPDLNPMRGKQGWALDPKWHMFNRTTGSAQSWEDHWQTSRSAKKWRRPPGHTDSNGPPGQPPAWMFIGPDEGTEG